MRVTALRQAQGDATITYTQFRDITVPTVPIFYLGMLDCWKQSASAFMLLYTFEELSQQLHHFWAQLIYRFLPVI